MTAREYLPTWVCPTCASTIQALATEVGHRCPCKRQNAWVAWERQPVRHREAYGVRMAEFQASM